jgi:hypothetical protein
VGDLAEVGGLVFAGVVAALAASVLLLLARRRAVEDQA